MRRSPTPVRGVRCSIRCRTGRCRPSVGALGEGGRSDAEARSAGREAACG